MSTTIVTRPNWAQGLHDVDEELRAGEADAAEVVEDQEDDEKDPAEDLGHALRHGAAIGVEKFLDRRHAGLPAEPCRYRPDPCPAHGWRHCSIGLSRPPIESSRIRRPLRGIRALVSLMTCRQPASCCL
jgi:hypothetical protein